MKDWQGREVMGDETPDTKILVWQVEPHLTQNGYVAWFRGWQDMLNHVATNLDMYLEQFDVDELLSGVSLDIRLIRISLGEYEESMDQD